jgi:hypothetical protein
MAKPSNAGSRQPTMRVPSVGDVLFFLSLCLVLIAFLVTAAVRH